MFIEFILSYNCNQFCDYCGFPKYNTNKAYVINIKLIKHVLDYYKKLHIPLFVEFSGGEPGLAVNLKEALDIVYTYKNVTKFQLLSNGLARIKLGNIPHKPKFFYNEHLIYDIINGKIQKFYDIEYCRHQRNVVILTKNTTESLINYPHIIDELKDFSEFKIINPKIKEIQIDNDWRSNLDVVLHKDIQIYQRSYKEMLQNIDGCGYIDKRLYCANNHESGAIDLQNERILQCSTMIFNSDYETINEKNLRKLYLNKLFFYNTNTIPVYCRNCYFYYQMNY